MLKRFLLVIFIFTAVFSLSANDKHSLSVDYVSQYVWRGINVMPDDVAAIQPSYTYNFDNKWYLNFWSSFALEQRDLYKDADELDFKLGYIFNKGEAIQVECAYMVILFCSVDHFTVKDSTTNAAYVKVTANDLALTPSFAVHYDFNRGSGAYFELAVNKAFKLNRSIGLNLFSSIGYNYKQFIDTQGFSDIVAGVSLPINLKKLSITPFVKYIYSPLDAIRAMNGGEKDDFMFGITLQII